MQQEVVGGGGGLANFLQCSKGGKYFYSAARGGEFSYKLEERKVVASQFFLQCSKKGGKEECFPNFLTVQQEVEVEGGELATSFLPHR